MNVGWPLPKRKEHLRELTEVKSEKTHPVPFQGRMQYLSVHQVPLGLPLYRLENGRTAGKQAEYIADHPGAGDNFFRSDGELETAQSVQHQILVQLARSSKNLFKEFEKNQQTEPIIISSIGYVVNGNRRLSTWRELYETDPEKFKRFRTIEVVILPFCDDRELDRVEAELQLKEDLKADYSWVSTALMMREKLERHKYKESELSSIYGKSKKEITEIFDCLDYANQYLESREISYKYSDVEDKEYAFLQICRGRRKMKDSDAKKELFEKAAFCLADEAGEGARIYAEIPKIADHIHEVVNSLVEELNLEAKDPSEDGVAICVSEALEDKENFETARLVIRDTIEAAETKKKNRRKRENVAALVTKARDNLVDAKSSMDGDSSTKGIPDLLDQIEVLAQEIRNWAASDEKE